MACSIMSSGISARFGFPDGAGWCRPRAWCRGWWSALTVCRWSRSVGVDWDKATPAEVRDLVLWLKQATKPRAAARTTSAATAGRVNPVTRKRHLGDQYEPRTIRHSNAVLRSFYRFWIDDVGAGPLINPVPLD
jgi:integrase/recombinase XerD